jgi:hypothetical protein
MLFVDAICINQRDYAERNRQLLLMKHIYQTATQVRVWIGRETETIDLAKSMLAKLGKVGRRANRGVRLELNTANLQSLGLPKLPSPDWSALRYFFRRAWFQRVWVIQEVVNASNLEILCGDQTLSWEDIVDAARCITDSTMYATTDTAHICQNVCSIDQYRRVLHRGSGKMEHLSLLSVLHGSRRCDATDLRDKIYGLYPLVEPQHELPSPDYSRPIDQIYRETAAYIIRTTGRLDVLGFAGAARHPATRHLNLPSWVPDWHAHDRAKPLVGMFPDHGLRADVRFSGNLDCITAMGVVLDEVVSISDTVQPFQGSIDGAWVDRAFRDWPDARERLEPTGEEVNIFDISLHLPVPPDGSTIPPNLSEGEGNIVRNNAVRLLYARRIFRSRCGYLGSISTYATIGDIIVLFRGASVPFVVRPIGANSYKLIGECYLIGFIGEKHFINKEVKREITIL